MKPLYQTKTATLAAGVTTDFQADAFLRVLKATGDLTIIATGANDFGPEGATVPTRVAIGGPLNADGSRQRIGPVRIQNNTGGPVTFTIATSNAPIDDSRDSVEAGIATSVTITGSVAVTGPDADGAAPSQDPVAIAGYDGAAIRRMRAQADNSALPTAGNPTAIPGYYSSAARAMTSGNIGFLTIDRGGKQVCVPGGTLDPVILGYSVATLQAGASTNATSVKALAGLVYELSAVNQAAYDVFVRLYDKAVAPTVGTDVAYRVVRVPAGQSVTVTFPGGAYFPTGIAFATTKLVAYNDNTALAANDVQLSLQYA